MGRRMSDSNNAVRPWTIFYFISQPEHTVKLRGNFLELLSEATEGNVRLFALDGEPVILINLADVSHAEVVYE